MNLANLRTLPRLVSLHQVARRAGIHRSVVTALTLRGQSQPSALQDVGNGREQFLFAADAVETAKRLVDAADASRPLL